MNEKREKMLIIFLQLTLMLSVLHRMVDKGMDWLNVITAVLLGISASMNIVFMITEKSED